MTQLRYKLKIRLLSKKKPKKNVRSAIRKSKRRKMMNRPSFNNILMKQQHQQEFVPLKITSQSTNYLLTQIRVKTKESLTTRLEDTTLCTLVKFSSIDMWSFRNWDGVILVQCGWLETQPMIHSLRWKSKRVQVITKKLPMTKSRSLIKSAKTRSIRHGLLMLCVTNIRQSTVLKIVTQYSSWIHLFTLVLMVLILLWCLRYWESTY